MLPYVDHRVNWNLVTKSRPKKDTNCNAESHNRSNVKIWLKLYMALKCLCLLTCMSLILHDTNRYWCFIASVYEDWESALGMIGWYQFYWCVIYGFFREVKEHCNEYRCEPDVGSADMLQLSGERPYGQVRIENRSSCCISSSILPGIARVKRREGTTLGWRATTARDQGTWPGMMLILSI